MADVAAAPAASAAPSSPAPSSAPSGGSSPSAAPAPSPASPPAPAGSPAPATAAAPTPPQIKRYKAKVNGQDREIDATHVDALASALGLDPQEILKGSAMAQSAYQRWQEAAKLRKEAEEREKAWKSRYEDPRVSEVKRRDPTLSDDEAWALVKTQELYERSQMNPDQRALAEERQRREQLERQAKEREEGEKKAKIAAETKAEAQKLDRSLTEALQKHALPKNPAWARAVLDHLAAAARAGAVPDVEGAVLFVKRRVQADDQSRLAALPDEALESWLGPAIIDRILKRSVEKVRAPVPAGAPPPPPKVEPKPEEGRKYLTVDEWRAMNGY
jgi:hypothetical protein